MRKYLTYSVLLLSALFSNSSYSNVTHNITFTIKNTGNIEVDTDLGVFDMGNETLRLNEAQIPQSFRNMSTRRATASDIEVSPVGYTLKSKIGNAPEFNVAISSAKFRVVQTWAFDGYNIGRGNCDGGTKRGDTNLYIAAPPDIGLSMNCGSYRAYTESATSYFLFNPTDISFKLKGVINTLRNAKPAVGEYSYQPIHFRFTQWTNTDYMQKRWTIITKLIVEPSIASVEMATNLPLDVSLVSGNQLTGRGSLLATVNGTLGQYLQIEPRSSNNGKLVKGNESIPYTLAVTPLSGDNKSRLLIDGTGSGNLAPVTIETFAKRDQYRLRFDAAFNVANTGLTSGSFNDSVTLIFSTPDMP